MAFTLHFKNHVCGSSCMFLSFNQIWKRSSSQLKRNFHRIKWQQVRISPQESISFMTQGSDFTIFHQQKLDTYPSAPPVVLFRLRVKPPSRKAVPSLGSNFIPKLVVNYHYWQIDIYQWIGLRENLQETIDFHLNQSNPLTFMFCLFWGTFSGENVPMISTEYKHCFTLGDTHMIL